MWRHHIPKQRLLVCVDLKRPGLLLPSGEAGPQVHDTHSIRSTVATLTPGRPTVDKCFAALCGAGLLGTAEAPPTEWPPSFPCVAVS